MKKYRLSCIKVNGKAGKQKDFSTRADAERYLNRLLSERDLQVTEIIYRNRKHNQEFYCNDWNRFSIDRVFVER